MAATSSTASSRLYRSQGWTKQLAELKALYGFDKPASQRFIDMLWRYARFDLGESFIITNPSAA